MRRIIAKLLRTAIPWLAIGCAVGTPLNERGRSESESQHRVRIPRTYAIATTEVTNEEFAKNQWVYPENIEADKGLDLPRDYLHRTGYRLPTEAEWEYAARAGTTTSWCFGDDDSLLPRHAWYDANTHRERTFPVARLAANPWGLFDMLGNVWEWTLDRRQAYPCDERVIEDAEDAALRVANDVARTRRGGSFAYEWFTTRSAHRGDTTYFPDQTRDGVGFRVARTMPPSP